MNNLTKSTGAKTAAVILLFAALALIAASFLGICFIIEYPTEDPEMFQDDFWGIVHFVYQISYLLIPICILSLLSAALLFTFLIFSAGRRHGTDVAVANPIDKIPFDILIAGIVFLICLATILLTEGYYGIMIIPIFAAYCIAVYLLVICFFMTLATRCKIGSVIKNTVIFMVLHIVSKILRRLCKLIGYIFSSAPLALTALGIFAGLMFIDIIASGSYNFETRIYFLMISRLILFIPFGIAVMNMRDLFKAGKKISAGDTDFKLNTSRLIGPFKHHGENLININKGLSAAVNEKMKSERMKTELITNVTHDIKTPLTSIINYVDLISKLPVNNEEFTEYTEVLTRQSNRLKKLVDDLLEASKASTGNIRQEPTNTDLAILLSQSVGEYTERLTAAELETIISLPDEPASIYADGRLVSRIFDNLIGNICKYSLPRTRVYATLETVDNSVRVTFKNISKYPLNISSDDLLERFVRGDTSRSTEGSGLGLSIAQSLTETQNGKMVLTVDGDLFKVMLTFPKL